MCVTFSYIFVKNLILVIESSVFGIKASLKSSGTCVGGPTPTIQKRNLRDDGLILSQILTSQEAQDGRPVPFYRTFLAFEVSKSLPFYLAFRVSESGARPPVAHSENILIF